MIGSFGSQDTIESLAVSRSWGFKVFGGISTGLNKIEYKNQAGSECLIIIDDRWISLKFTIVI